MKWLVVVTTLIMTLAISAGRNEKIETVVHFFWAEGCPHCAEALPFLQAVTNETPNTRILAYEVLHNRDNARALIAFAGRHGYKPHSVPAIFIGSRHWVGFNSEIAEEIRSYLKTCATRSCPEAATFVVRPAQKKAVIPPPVGAQKEETPVMLDVPFAGRHDISHGSLWANTALIAFADGFNPCSLWVLTMLLALIIHTGSRRKVFLVGLVFLTVTSLVYVAFIAGIFSIMNLVGVVTWVRSAMAVLTLGMGLINIKDYFWFGKGVSLTIAAEKKPGILARMRDIMNASGALWPMLLATVFLAGGVSLAEFSCTAGFPVLWVNLVTAQHVSTTDFTLLLLLYMVIYQIDEMLIFITVIFTLRIGRFQEKQGRLLKLVGGTLMCTLAAVLLVRPALLDKLSSSLMVFSTAVALALLILLLHRFVLPAIFISRGATPPQDPKAH
jgi:glutaredoxin